MRKTSFILALVILTVALAGCQPANVSSADTTAGGVTDTLASETEAASGMVSIVADGASDYMVLRADRASETEIDAAVALRKAIETLQDEVSGIS